ncbi:MAG: SpoIIE family protein phosphatase [Betaproteobacteria bacterium]
MTPVKELDRDDSSAADVRTGGLRILAVDDSAPVRALLKGFLEREGHEVTLASDGDHALELFESVDPDLVLMDVVMPKLDGIEATRRIRCIAPGRWVPVILLSALDSEDDAVQGLRAGADDYLAKPLNLSILKAKISSFRRIADMQLQLAQQASALALFHEEQIEEQELANALIGNFARSEGLADPAIDWAVLPSQRFSGDVVAAVRSPSGALYTMLGDATGHGLTASVSLIPALQIFYGMGRKGMPLGQMVAEINARLKELLPVGRYLAVSLMVLDEQARAAEVWNGGLPPTLVIDAQGECSDVLESAHLPLGILGEADFDSSCAVLRWSGPAEVVFYSDGVIEAQDAAGIAFGLDRLRQGLSAAGAGTRAERVEQDLRAHLGAIAATDDASILAVLLP